MSSLMARLSDSDFDWNTSGDNYQINNNYTGHDSLEEEIEKVDILKEAWTRASNKLKGQADDKLIAKMCYTLEHPRFYDTLNSELRKWFNRGYNNENKKFPFSNYTKLMESQTNKLSRSLTLWRGVKNKNLTLRTKGAGSIILNQFFSCSIVKETAEKFASENNDGILFKFDTTFAIEIGKDSFYPNEKEYLIPPGIEFMVTNRYQYATHLEIHLKLVEIKIASSIRSDLVLDASNSHVTLQKFRGDALQCWVIQGRYIRNSGNGKTLDVDMSGLESYNKTKMMGHPLCTYWLHGGPNQQWFNRFPMIESGINGLVVDVKSGAIQEGISIIVWAKNKTPNQLFTITYVS